MVFQFISNHLVFSEIEKAFDEMNILLFNKYILNIVLSELFFKNLVIKNLLDKNYINNELIVFNNDSLIFNSYILNNVLG